MTLQRNDPHRPSVIRPSEYSYVLDYALAHEFEGEILPPFNMDEVLALKSDPAVRWAPTGGIGKCSVCGANFIYGVIWQHDQTGEHIHLGHECADKYGLISDSGIREEWERSRALARRTIAENLKRAAARESFLAATPGLADDLALKSSHRILADLDARLTRYGSLTEKQVALAHRLAEEVRNPPPPEVLVPAPQGLVTVRGEVVSAKYHESSMGEVLKLTVKVRTPDGNYLVWTTAPVQITRTLSVRPDGEFTASKEEFLAAFRGKWIEFTATLTPGRDAHFAFANRPRKASVIDEQKGEYHERD